MGIKIVIEGQEEVGSALDLYPPSQPELFESDAMIIGDTGSVRPGTPTMTISLRGMAAVIVSATRLPAGAQRPFGAARATRCWRRFARLRFSTMTTAMSRFTARRDEWTGASYSDDEFRDLAEINPGLPFLGTGGLGDASGRARR